MWSSKRLNKDSKFTSNFTDIHSSNMYIRHMSDLMLFRTVALRQLRECPEGTHSLTYKMIKNIKLPAAFCREYSVLVSYHFFETDKMK